MNVFKQQLIDLIKAWEIPTSNHYHDSVIMSECHNCNPEPEPEPEDKFQRRPIIGRRALNPIQDLTNPIHEAKRKEDQFKKDLRALHDMIMRDTEEKEQKRPKMGWCPCCTCHSCYEK